MWVWLRLKLLADVGLVGLPNAGKSTFLNSVTNASAKVGDYPFTTLRPQLGVVRHKGREFVLADIPGLIEGAAEGAGIGDRFLGHVERTEMLLHLVDAAGEDPVEAWRVVRGELESYGAGLAGKAEIVALSRADLVDEERLPNSSASSQGDRPDPFPISAPLGEGIGPCSTRSSSGRHRSRGQGKRRRRTIGPGRRSDPRRHRRHRLRRPAADRSCGRAWPSSQALTRRPQDAREGVDWIEGSLEDRDALERLVTESDAVIHVAGVINAPNAAGFEAGNVTGTLAMLAAATAAGTQRFVHVSSLAAREPKLSQYGASKARSEELVEAPASTG